MSDPHDEAHIAALNKVLGSASTPPADDLVERAQVLAICQEAAAREGNWGTGWQACAQHIEASMSSLAPASEIARLRQKLEDAERSGPGSPRARLEYLLDELERLFPDAHKRIMSDLGEPKYVAAIESLQAALTLAQSQRDAAVEFIGVMRDETVLAGFPAGDRAVLLANFRAILAQRDALAKALRAVNTLIAEGALTGFNPHSGDWAQRLYDSQQETSRALASARAQAMDAKDGPEV